MHNLTVSRRQQRRSHRRNPDVIGLHLEDLKYTILPDFKTAVEELLHVHQEINLRLELGQLFNSPRRVNAALVSSRWIVERSRGLVLQALEEAQGVLQELETAPSATPRSRRADERSSY